MTTTLPLEGRTALITGASRTGGIGAAVARRPASVGASLVIHHHRPHDSDQPWGADDLERVLASVRESLAPGAELHDLPGDLAEPGAPEGLVGRAVEAAGPLDILVCNHARSGGDGALADITAEQLDGHWAADARSVLLLTKAFAARHDAARPGGRVIWMTSGQQQGPMPGEVAYAAAKAALAGVTATVADELADRGIVLDTVNPGPVNTGYLDPGVCFDDRTLDALRRRFPSGRFGTPDDPARLIGWLVGDDGEWVVGQVLDTEGGFRRW
ncbi:SDR family oxidoreductase [Streptomyces sp. NPDC002644]